MTRTLFDRTLPGGDRMVPTGPVRLSDLGRSLGVVGLWLPGVSGGRNLAGAEVAVWGGTSKIAGTGHGPSRTILDASSPATISAPSNVLAPSQITLLADVFYQTSQTYSDEIVKNVNASGWTAPYWSYYLGISGGSQNPETGVLIGGAQKTASLPVNSVSVGNRYLLAGTYDQTNIRMWLNGTLGATTAQSGAIDYPVANSPIYLGGTPPASVYSGSLGAMYAIASLAWDSAAVEEWSATPYFLLESADPMGAFWWVGGGGGTTVALVGATATTAAGTFYPALTFLLPGAAAATTAGNLSISEVAPIPGAAAAAAAGNFSIAETIPVTGAAAATAAGIFSLSESFTLTGVAAATAAGNIGVSIGTTVPLIGAAAAATAGTISLSESFMLPAAAATAAAGILGATTGIVVSLTGVTATAAAAPLGISTTVTLAGAAAATAAGAFGIDLALALAGAAAATAAGTITPYTGTVLLQGAAVATAAGIILVETVNPATMTVLVNFTILPPTLPAPNPPPATGPGDVLVTFGT